MVVESNFTGGVHPHYYTVECLCDEPLYNKITFLTKVFVCTGQIPIFHVYCERLYSRGHYNEKKKFRHSRQPICCLQQTH